MFVGSGRVAEVERLVAAFDAVRTGSVPALITYVAPPGWGKTRLVQELYLRLAAVQAEPWYWPPSLVGEPGAGAVSSGDLATGRKAVRPRQPQAPAGAVLPWLWLTLPSARLGDGSPAPAVEQLVVQLTPHLPQLLGRLDGCGGPVQAAARRAVAGVLSPWDLRALSAAAPEVGRAIAAEDPGDGTADVAGDVAALLRQLSQPLPPAERTPVVVVVDDAHDLDESAVNFIKDLISTDLPTLLIATTWPEHVGAGPDGPPFCAYLHAAATAERSTVVHLDQLDPDDLVAFVLHQFPGTDPLVASRLAARADRNPYALRLLLDTALVQAASRNGPIELRPAEVDDLKGGLDDLLRQHWTRLPVGVQQTLATTALLGESVLDDVLIAALGEVRPAGGLGATLATAWIRLAGERARIVEFIERIRYDVARSAAPAVLAVGIRSRILYSALRAVRYLLDDDVREARQVLLALHVGLARAGVEPDLPSAGRSAGELAEITRHQHRRLDAITYLDQAVTWLDTGDDDDRRTAITLRIDLTAAIRAEYTLALSEPHARLALRLADALDPHDELRIRARISLARSLMRRTEPEQLAASIELLREAEALTDGLDAPSPLLIHDLWAMQAHADGIQGRRADATRRYRDVVAHCERHFGDNHRYTLGVMESLAYNALRSGDIAGAVTVRREILRRRIGLIGDAGYLPTMPTRTNLAAGLMRLGTEAALDEAEQLALEAKTVWSRAYGVDGARTQRSRLVLAVIWQRRGLLREGAGDVAAAKELFERAAEETGKVLVLRQQRHISEYPLALMRHGVSQACLRDHEAIGSLTESLRLREVELRQTRHHWETQECAEFLAWAYERLGQPLEAASIRRLYRLPDTSG
ncbi:hypothetical protein ACFO1B_02785 [Dactylosporangium siamense]|uniref:Orc1-like AAA ATPase domain-containing protein n=1 Tax=Dactylosporangium siamense TaxID=685454 RepID=A0A919UAJ8_9ACTN|nr:hypothetical protein [Dactylosporangium siamense]GIG48594.1 hypothetical protein Dsi01nite_066350 [Dactylosporangium siamense]